MKRLLILTMCLPFSYGALEGQSWTQLSPSGTGPAGLANAKGAYDALDNLLIVFGGVTSSGLSNDTWTLSHANGLGGVPVWTKLSPSGIAPDPRADHTAVYDRITNELIIFGGYIASGVEPSDVWLLKNANGLFGTPQWVQLQTPVNPPSRIAGSAVYDPLSNRMIIFGGCSGFAYYCGPWLNDTWVLTNANGRGFFAPAWNQLVTAGALPPVRASHAVGYDPVFNRMTVFGGGNSTDHLNDTWILGNANGLGGSPVWNQILPTNPPNTRYDGAWSYDAFRNQLIIATGVASSVPGPDSYPFPYPDVLTNATFVLEHANGIGTAAWSQILPAGPLPSPRQSLAADGLDIINNRFILFGGSDSRGRLLNDVWVLDMSR